MPTNPVHAAPVVVEEPDLPVEGRGEHEKPSVTWRTLLSGDRTPTDSLTLGVADVEPIGAAEPLVHHHAQPEAYYVLSGEGVVRVADRDYPLRTGTTVFIPGNVEHGAIATGTETLRILYVFAADSFSEVEYVFP